MKPAERRRRILTAEEVADLFHVSPRTARRWATTGQLRAAHTLGGPWWFDRNHAEQAQQEHIVRPEPYNRTS